MRHASRRLAATALLAAAATGCGTEPSRAVGPTSSSALAESAAPSSSPAAAQPAVQTVRLSYAGGQVSGDTGRVNVPLGTTVDLVVTGDTAEQVHLHGYDRYLDVAAGGTATLRFTADIPGVFEVELHDGLLLTQLAVG